MTSAPTIVRKSEDVSGYTWEELAHFRRKFSAEIEDHQAKARRFALPILILFAAGLGAVLYSFLCVRPPLTWLLIAGFALVATGLILTLITGIASQSELVCPACRNYFIEEIQDHCPECGSTSLGYQDWRGSRECRTCGKNLRPGKNRNFKYKACTTCGVFLYRKGL
jgi:RNA polymerase subunit RPABC4/transcription elongation factor Spt4